MAGGKVEGEKEPWKDEDMGVASRKKRGKGCGEQDTGETGCLRKSLQAPHYATGPCMVAGTLKSFPWERLPSDRKEENMKTVAVKGTWASGWEEVSRKRGEAIALSGKGNKKKQERGK